MRIEKLRDKAASLPMTPGVYIMKDESGEIIYVGKSKKLKNRVSSYFIGNTHSPKTYNMVMRVFDFDYIVCKTEIEALTLENVLIKEHSPKYNIRLKDSKTYPYIKMTREDFPRLIVTRERTSDRARYFGPYASSSAAHTALLTVKKILGIPTCKLSFPKDIKKTRPCIYRDMGRCVAPCTGEVSREDYARLVSHAADILGGNIGEVKRALTEEMQTLSENLEFERAAGVRDSINALSSLIEKQKVVGDTKITRDVFGIYTEDGFGILSLLSIRGGALLSKNDFAITGSLDISDEDVVSLIASHYDGGASLPKEIMLAFDIDAENLELLSEYLSILRGARVTVRMPERGGGRALCDMANKNAEESARQMRLTSERENKNIKRITELLSLDSPPRRIEAYDISNIGDESIVASMVVYEGGRLKKSDYRLFTIKTTGGQDDYGSMREALTRRLSHIGDGTASLGERPDLILVDGGEGHVAVAKEVLSSLGEDITVFGMVKDDYHKTRALTDGRSEISIAKEFEVYAFVYNLQEEAHRFALKASSNSKRKTLTHSVLEKIEGIGSAKARALLSAYPLGKIKSATVEELCSVKGIGKADAERVFEYFRKSKVKK
ncbi:MAG: excinuclease ABC subunit UvrC [Clostridia bacterium]|nr:excinuclease ABC subunit UvrC [Clostridia bacterium]